MPIVSDKGRDEQSVFKKSERYFAGRKRRRAETISDRGDKNKKRDAMNMCYNRINNKNGNKIIKYIDTFVE